MSLSQDVEVLRTIPLFAKIEPPKLKLLAFTSERLEFMDGDALFHQGDVGDAAYIILRGRADVMVDSRERRGQGRAPEQQRHHRRDRDPVRRAAHRDRGRRDRSRHAARLQGRLLPPGQPVPADRHRGDARAGLAPASHHPGADLGAGAAQRARQGGGRAAAAEMTALPAAVAVATAWPRRPGPVLDWLIGEARQLPDGPSAARRAGQAPARVRACRSRAPRSTSAPSIRSCSASASTGSAAPTRSGSSAPSAASSGPSSSSAQPDAGPVRGRGRGPPAPRSAGRRVRLPAVRGAARSRA